MGAGDFRVSATGTNGGEREATEARGGAGDPRTETARDGTGRDSRAVDAVRGF